YDYRIEESEPLIIDWAPMIRQILNERPNTSLIAAKFQNTLAAIVVDVARRANQQKVLLTGGCFQNRYLTERTVNYLNEAGLSVYWHQRVPPNDGGISLGQVMAVRHAMEVETPCVLQYQAS